MRVVTIGMLWVVMTLMIWAAPAAADEASAKTDGIDIKIYGYIKADAVYQDKFAIMDQFLVWATPDNPDRDTFSITARQSRFGLLVSGPVTDGVQTKGVIEGDFYGTYVVRNPGQDPEENKGQFMLRRAFVDIAGETWSLLAGNEWMVVSPLYPHVNNYPYAAEMGNLGYRAPQVRLTGNFLDKRLIFQIAAVNKLGDVEIPGTDIDTGRQRAVPTTEVGLTWKQKGYQIGVTGHYGQEEVQRTNAAGDYTGLGEHIDSWSANLHFSIPIGDMLAVSGEIWSGANLDGWYTGGQGSGWVRLPDEENPDVGTYEPVEVSGGWLELMFKPPIDNCKLKFYAGYGVDDVDEDQIEGGTIEPGYGGKPAANVITKNEMIYVNAWYAVNKNVMISAEWMNVNTEYDGLDADGDVNRYTLSFWYLFM